MNKALAVLLLVLSTFTGSGIVFYLGTLNEQENFQPRVLNEWYMVRDSDLYIYRKGYIQLPRTERDSVRLDAINKLRPL